MRISQQGRIEQQDQIEQPKRIKQQDQIEQQKRTDIRKEKQKKKKQSQIRNINLDWIVYLSNVHNSADVNSVRSIFENLGCNVLEVFQIAFNNNPKGVYYVCMGEHDSFLLAESLGEFLFMNKTIKIQKADPIKFNHFLKKYKRQEAQAKQDVKPENMEKEEEEKIVEKEEKEEKLTIEDECNVCLENKKDSVLLPCAHRTVCLICAKKLSQCPICRSKISQIIKIFDA